LSLDVSGLSPSDAVAALRSFPRRFREVLAVDDDDDGPLHRAGPDGRSALDHADLAGRDLAVLADTVGRVLDGSTSALHPAVTDLAARSYASDVSVTAEAAVDLLELEARGLADRAEHVDAGSWGETADVAGGGKVTALDVLREAVRTTAEHLRAAELARGG